MVFACLAVYHRVGAFEVVACHGITRKKAFSPLFWKLIYIGTYETRRYYRDSSMAGSMIECTCSVHCMASLSHGLFLAKRMNILTNFLCIN